MKLVGQILTGSLFYVEIGEDAVVQDLKNEIGNQENLPADRLILMLDANDDRHLLDKEESSLKDYGVQDGSHIYVFFQPVIESQSTESDTTIPGSTSSQDSDSEESPATLVTPSSPILISSEPENEEE